MLESNTCKIFLTAQHVVNYIGSSRKLVGMTTVQTVHKKAIHFAHCPATLFSNYMQSRHSCGHFERMKM
jgi:hypothetical protein